MDVCRTIENMVINPTGRQQAVIVSTLPAAGAENYLYLVPDGDTYSVYKYENDEWVSVSGGV